MTIRLNIWQHPATGEARIYVQGTNRDNSKLWFGAGDGDRIQKHSINLDTPASRLSGDAYGKRDKDVAIMAEVLARFGMTDRTFTSIKDAVQANTLVEIVTSDCDDDDE